jgi:aminoglycoside 3-N-acetyltransferase
MALGIGHGATVYVASNVARFGVPAEVRALVKSAGPDALMRSHIDTLREIVGSSGTLIMPTFTYSACNDEVYDPRKTPSVVGSLTDYFWRQEGVQRSRHPIFSAAAVGPAAAQLLSMDDPDCFGAASLFGKLREANATYLMYGVNMWEGATYVYHSEQRASVRYRYIKEFDGRILRANGDVDEVPVPYFVRDLDLPYRDSWRPLQAESIAAEVTRMDETGRVPMLAHEAKSIDEFIRARLDQDADYLIDLN